MPFQRLARVEEVPPGQTKFIWLEPLPILLANVEGTIYALSGICPHQENPLEGAVLWGNLVDCPWHHFQFDACTGENHFPRNVYPEDMPALDRQVRALETFAVDVRDGEVWVNLDA
jgi:nitrite reductase/ring-hydroxylating ferredoxin subunit